MMHDMDPTSLPSLSVLVADDDPVMRMLLGRFVEDTSLSIDFASDGQEALDKLMTGQYQLAIIDGDMPSMDGFETARRLRAWESKNAQLPIPLVALTGHSIEVAGKRARGAGFTGILTKPIGKRDFLRALLTALRGVMDEAGASFHPSELLRLHGTEERIQVVVDQDLRQLVEAFLAEKAHDVEWAREALTRQHFDALRHWAHRFAGTGHMCGLKELAELGHRIEEQATAANETSLQCSLGQLADYLERIAVEYTEGD